MGSRRDLRGPLPADGTVVVVGASLAGFRAARGLRDEGFAGRLVLVGEERHLPYDRPPLSKQVLAGTWEVERTRLADAGQLSDLGLQCLFGHRAVSLDADAARVELDDGSTIEADALVIATGAHPRRLPGTEELGGVEVLRTIEDVSAIREAIQSAGDGCRIVVIGAGFIGSEVAATCAGSGCRVTVLEALDAPLASALGARVGAACGRLHGLHGVTLLTGVKVTAVENGSRAGRALQVVLDDGTRLDADVVVVGIGVQPSTDWLVGSGLTIGDGVRCDAALFAADRIVAAGDVARWTWSHLDHDEDVRIEHWEVASQMGSAVARSLVAGRERAPHFDPVPYFWSDQYGLRIQVLGRPDPTDDIEVVDGDLESDDGKFVAVYGRDGKLSAALGVSRPRQLMAFRPLLEAGATWQEGVNLLASKS
jgi:3-phenylpropionate/trans-cinnamate dioxygenase ferredoxin reductase subunit